MPPAAARDRFFQQSHAGGDHSRTRKQHKPRTQQTATGGDLFFVASHDSQQRTHGASEDREQLQDEDEGGDEEGDVDQRQQAAPPTNRNHKRPRLRHAPSEEAVDDGDSHPSSAASSRPSHPPKRRKDAPLEMSSKHPTPLPALSARHLLQPRASQARDPRFDSLLPATSFSAHFNAKAAYGFVDALRDAEVADMRRAQKRARSQQARQAVQAELQQVVSARREQERREREQAALRTWRKQEMAARREGKKPFFLKERDKKAVKLVSEYARLKERGQEGAIVRKVAKKRRQRAQHDQRSMPRQATDGGN